MLPATPLPRSGAIFLDTRNDRRALRVTWHHEQELVVLSLWRDNVCAATFRLAATDVPALIAALRAADGAGAADGGDRSAAVAPAS